VLVGSLVEERKTSAQLEKAIAKKRNEWKLRSCKDLRKTLPWTGSFPWSEELKAGSLLSDIKQ
jgi:hypothetical protein